MSAILLKDAEIVGEDSRVDLLIEGGKIAEKGSEVSAPDEAEVVDCASFLVLPGMCDLHVHAPSVMDAAAAAVAGGVTRMVLMPDRDPPVDSGPAVRSALDLATRDADIGVWQAGCISKGRDGSELAGIAAMAEHIPFITDNGAAIESPSLMRRAMEYASDFGLPVATHGETRSLSRDGAMNEGAVSYALGLPGMPSVGEVISLERDIGLAAYTGAHLHIQQVSTARGVEAVRRAKADGIRVTAEVSAHHLIFSENDIGDYDTNFKTNPPLRTVSDCESLLHGLKEGTIDFIATDHSPQSDFQKAADFGSAPFGMTGLETTLLALFDRLIKPGRLDWETVVRAYSQGPAEFINEAPIVFEKGHAADLVIFDPEGETSLDQETLCGGRNTPFEGQKLAGKIVRVICPS